MRANATASLTVTIVSEQTQYWPENECLRVINDQALRELHRQYNEVAEFAKSKGLQFRSAQFSNLRLNFANPEITK